VVHIKHFVPTTWLFKVDCTARRTSM